MFRTIHKYSSLIMVFVVLGVFFISVGGLLSDSASVLMSYLVGSMLTLFVSFNIHWNKRVEEELTRSGKYVTWQSALDEFVFTRTLENAVSWATTIGFVWSIGAWYSGAFAFFGVVARDVLPIHESVAFTLGTLVEALAPGLMSTIVTRITGKFK